MKKIIGAAAAAGCALLAGQALAEPVGYIGAGYGYNEIKFEDEGTGHLNGYTIDGGVAYDAFSKFRLTGDAGFTWLKQDHVKGEDTVWAGTLHATDKDSRFGAFLGAADNEEVTLWGVGAEGKLRFDKASVYGQVGYGQVGNYDNVDLWAVRVEGNYFPTNNVRLGAGLGGSRINSDLLDLDMFTATAEAEYKLDAHPVSFVAGYDYVTINDVGYDGNVFRVGARYTFGGDLKARDKTTAGQGSVQTLFGGAFGSTIFSVFGAVLSEFND